jgi:hypothetical protein
MLDKVLVQPAYLHQVARTLCKDARCQLEGASAAVHNAAHSVAPSVSATMRRTH